MRILPLLVVVAFLLAAALGLQPRSIESQRGDAGIAGASPQRVDLVQLADKGQPILAVAGPQGRFAFTRTELEALGSYRVRSASFWPSDEGVYEGPLLAKVLASAGLDAVARIRLLGSDGFETTIPREDWTRWKIILATRRDGAVLEPASKGPVRIIYPRDSDRTLRDPVYRLRWIWMIELIDEAAP